jgi:hypothetical protein
VVSQCSDFTRSHPRIGSHARDAFSPRQGHHAGRPEADMNSWPEHAAGGSAAHGPSDPRASSNFGSVSTSPVLATRRKSDPSSQVVASSRFAEADENTRAAQSSQSQARVLCSGKSGQAVTPVSSRRPTSRCRFATADRQGRGHGSPPGAVRAASRTRAGRRAPRIRGPPHAPP